MNKNKDNIVLGEAYKYSNKAEDEYADKGEVVISKILKNEIDLISEDELNENTKYEVLSELFKAINTTGYYLTNVTFEEYNIKLQKAEEEKNIINQVAEQEFKSIGGVRPFGR